DWPNTQKVVSRSLQGEPLTTRAIEKMTKWRGIESLNEPVNPHMLRHTFATKLMRVTDMATVQNLLGHKNLNSTQRYTHPNTEDTSAAIEKMNKPGEKEKDVV
ncbi:tyrosine-type recombinase/integrase, partial [Candidatus Pacearchaeota archaeon]|nr:tyrosine-type recombinase/integrase [Candidatus Pacearchaeota archaeon]